VSEFLGQEIQVVSVSLPVGIMLDYAGTTAPADWMKAEGQPLNKSEYSALYAVLGEAFGTGDGSGAQFNLPDTRFRTSVGADATRPRGTVGGEEKHALSITEVPSHAHGSTTDIDQPDHSHHIDFFAQDPNWYAGVPQLIVGTGAAGSQYGANYFPANTQQGLLGLISGYQHNHRVLGDTGGVSGRHNHAILPEGGGQQHENMPPFVVLTKIIKVV